MQNKQNTHIIGFLKNQLFSAHQAVKPGSLTLSMIILIIYMLHALLVQLFILLAYPPIRQSLYQYRLLGTNKSIDLSIV